MANKQDKPLKVDQAHHERLKRIGFQKGQSGNPKGRPPIPSEVKDAMASHTLEAIQVLVDVMRSSDNDAAKVKAATHILGPFVSKAPQTVEVDIDVNMKGFGDFLIQSIGDYQAITKAQEQNVIEAEFETVERK